MQHEPLPGGLGSSKKEPAHPRDGKQIADNHPLLKPRNDVYGSYDPSFLQTTGPKAHTQSPAVTGTSVVAVKFNGGVAIATDNLGMIQPVERSRAFLTVLSLLQRRMDRSLALPMLNVSGPLVIPL